MQRKSLTLLTLLTVTALALLLFTGCGKSGNRFANVAPDIQITSYEGADDSDLLSPYADSLFLFQQKIYWNATDPDGVITGFAYRVSRVERDPEGNITSVEPVPTPGNDSIDDSGTKTPTNVLERFGTGWVLHSKPNSEDKSIWTNVKYATVNFPAADEFGAPQVIESLFEVIAIDNRGDITPLDTSGHYVKRSKAWRGFNARSDVPTCIVTTTKGNPEGKAVGAGLRLNFTMIDTDPFISHAPYKFEFKMVKTDTTGVVTQGEESPWYDTAISPFDNKIDFFLLTAKESSTPRLTYDFTDGVLTGKTKIVARAYDMAGVVSTRTDSILFAVKPGFRPKTIVYKEKTKSRIYALGERHFMDYSDDSIKDILPDTYVAGAHRFANYFFIDMNGENAAIHSPNIKVWLRWGWRGEYGHVVSTASGDAVQFTDNPFDKKVDTVLDRATDKNYFSEITHFDLRLDNQPYDYLPLAGDPNAHITDGDGKQWLRVPLDSPLGQTLVLPALLPGQHNFEVRCVDLQGEVDPEPAVYSFNLVAYVPPAQRNGILVIDDDESHPSYSPEDSVRVRYESMLSDYSGPVDYIKRGVAPIGDTYEDERERQISPTDLQRYKLVIYHSDNPSSVGKLKSENDGLTIYMTAGGNVLISHTAKLSETLVAFNLAGQRSFLNFFGITIEDSVAPLSEILSSSLASKPYFQKALGQTTYPDIDLAFTANPGGEPSFNTIVNGRQGLSTITYFMEDTNPNDLIVVPNDVDPGNVIYRMGIKPTNYPAFPPTQAEYDLYNNKPIGIRKINANNSRCFMLGFPLSYMQQADARAFINEVIAGL